MKQSCVTDNIPSRSTKKGLRAGGRTMTLQPPMDQDVIEILKKNI
jgi:hypothetical protein